MATYNQTITRGPSTTIGAAGTYRDAPAGGPRPKGINTHGTDQLAYTREVQAPETVQHQLTGLLASSSPYMQQARLGGERMANSRGLLNSSIAAGASQAEAIKAGLPIASQDASTYSQAAADNQEQMNAAIMQRRDLMNRLALGQLDAGVASEGHAVQAEGIRTGLLNNREQRAFLGEQQGLDRAHEFGMEGYRTQLSDWLRSNDTRRADWINERSFNRQAYFDLSTLPLQTGMAVGGYLMRMAVENPDLYSREDIMALQAFFGQDFYGGQFDQLDGLLDYYSGGNG